MKVHLHIDAPIRTTESVTDVTFSDTVMVSLDCCECCRCWRSVVLDKSRYLSYCTPTKHKFNGKIIDLKSTKDEDGRVTTGQYLIEYDYTHFIDAKYPERIPKSGSTWARVKYCVRCKCGANITHETQNNRGRQFEIPCECGAILVSEVEEIPKIYESPS